MESVLTIIQEFAPRPFRTTSNPKSKYTGKCCLCEYESRSGSNHYFTIHENEELWSCQVCGAAGNAFQLRRLLSHGHTYVAPTPAPQEQSRQSSQTVTWEGATVEEIAATKGLPAQWLKNTLGWTNIRYPGSNTPVISIPYPNINNTDSLTRYRVSVDGQERFRWKRFNEGQRTRLYGLQFLEQIQQAGYVILVEGETDFATLHYHGFPVLGVPGANAWNREWANHIRGLSVYVWQEPDTGGNTFVEKIGNSVPEVRVIEAPPGIKDPNEMFQQSASGFAEWVEEEILLAEPYQRPQSKAETKGKVEDNATLGGVNLHLSDERRDKVIAAYFGNGEDDIANRIRFCSIWKKVGDMACGVKVGKPMHCHKKGCPNCDRIAFHVMMDDKAAILVEHLKRPVVLEFPNLFTDSLEGTYEGDLGIVASGYKRLRKLLSDLSNSLGKREPIGKDYFYSLLCTCEGGKAQFGVMLLANEQENDLELLTEFFSKKVGQEVKGRRTTGRADKMQRYFGNIHLERFKWEKDTEFYAWIKAEKGKKEIGGKGCFVKIGVKPEPLPKAESEYVLCPVHGVMEEIVWTKMIAPPQAWRESEGASSLSIMIDGGEKLWLHLDDEFKGRREQYK